MNTNAQFFPRRSGHAAPSQPLAISRLVEPLTLPQISTLPSLQTILDLPAFRSAELISGGEHIGEPVTWVHISEIMDIWRFLSGGELLLSTGLELVRVSPAARIAYIQGLARAGVRALGLELVQWITEVPAEIIDTARELVFPLIVFRSEVSFSDLTRAAHEEILRPTRNRGLESTMQTILNALIETSRDKDFLHRELGPLLALPARPRTTMLTTLEALLDAHFNIAEAARKLGVRRQSIYYRLEQLTGLLGSLDDPSRKLGFLVALALLRRSALPVANAIDGPSSRKGINP
ncbi:PucR family transcriptional regulator [Granulicella arctica]|uniref:Purine catabolism regulator n=1 Tax=Granulicella arctica TaxID=940613 RepID=A0A7Y9THN7_9BACT|nr:PucR family transcriptional regulator [Granulicella arctica]NYF80080.1 purine catabolism regulator [Granulicella arctica]